MPVVRSPSPRTAARSNPRSPQWKSRTGTPKNSRPMNDSTGFPIRRWSHGMAPGCDPTGEPVAHHQLRPGAQGVDERIEGREVVAVVGVAHDDVPAAGGMDPAEQRAAVPGFGDGHDAGAGGSGDLRRAVGAAVVGHQHLAVDVAAAQVVGRLGDAGRQRLRLVQARHEDRQLTAGRVGHVGGVVVGSDRPSVADADGQRRSAAGGPGGDAPEGRRARTGSLVRSCRCPSPWSTSRSASASSTSGTST